MAEKVTSDDVLSLFSGPLHGVENVLPGLIILFNSTYRGTHKALSPTLQALYWTADVSSPESPSFELFDYLDRSFARLERTFVSAPPDSEFALKQAVVDCLRRILYQACDSRTVFPQLAPDGDGGLVAVWHAGELMVQINTDDELHSEFIFVRGNEIQTLQQESMGELRRRLLELSKHVNKNNPGWRRLFSDS